MTTSALPQTSLIPLSTCLHSAFPLEATFHAPFKPFNATNARPLVTKTLILLLHFSVNVSLVKLMLLRTHRVDSSLYCIRLIHLVFLNAQYFCLNIGLREKIWVWRTPFGVVVAQEV